jgi:hypothetical protein
VRAKQSLEIATRPSGARNDGRRRSPVRAGTGPVPTVVFAVRTQPIISQKFQISFKKFTVSGI